MIPAGLSPRRLLVIIDFSWWLNLAFRVAGIEGMAPIVVGRFVELFRGDAPACLAVAVDSVGPTWRHELTDGMPELAAYKGRREPKPREFYALSNRLLDIVRLHRVPLLAAEGWEADDCFAAAVPLARAAGLEVVMLSADKDLGQLVGDGVWLWDGDKRLRGPTEIAAEWGVRPDQLGDLFAIVGDSSDNIRGIEGLGPTKAAAILRECGDLENALAMELLAPSEDAIKAAEKARAKAKKSGDAGALAVAQEALELLRETRNLALWLGTLREHADDVRLARRLVELDSEAPIEWDLAELPIGGYDAPAIRRAYLGLGFGNLAAEIGPCPKVPIDNFDSAPEGEEDHDESGEGQEDLHEGERPDRGGERGDDLGRDGRPRRDVHREGGRAEVPLGGAAVSPEGRAGDRDRGGRRDAVLSDGLDFEPPPLGDASAARLAETARRAREEARPTPGCCGYSGCMTDPVHTKARELVAAIRTAGDAVGALIAIKRLGMLELPTEEHCAPAAARLRELEKGAA